MDQHDLPVVSNLLKQHAVRALHLVRSREHVIETGPTGCIPVAGPQVGDTEFPRWSGRQNAINPNPGKKMVPIFIEPYSVRRDCFLKECGIAVIESGNDGLHYFSD